MTVNLVCDNCGNAETVDEFSTYTGQRIGTGFECTCSVCRGTMRETRDHEILDPDDFV
jgi:hypothetical protein